MPGPRGGFTLVELLVAMSVAAVVAALSWPGLQSQWTRARRADATAALRQLEAAQANHHARHGSYSADPRALGTAAAGRSPDGLYRIAFDVGPGEVFTAVAEARADGPQARDRDCAVITLRVEEGFAQRGPSPACWAR